MNPILTITYQPPEVHISLNGTPLLWPYISHRPIDEWGIPTPEENWKGLQEELLPLLGESRECIVCFSGSTENLNIVRVLLKNMSAKYMTEEELSAMLAAEEAARQAAIAEERARAEAALAQAAAEEQAAARLQSEQRLKKLLPLLILLGAVFFVAALLLLILMLHHMSADTEKDAGNTPETTITAEAAVTETTPSPTETTAQEPAFLITTAVIETVEETTTTTTEFSIPEVAEYVDAESYEPVYYTGTLENMYQLDLEGDGEYEQVAKYYCSALNDYFYHVYKDETFLRSTSISTGLGCGIGYNLIVTDPSGRNRLASLVFKDVTILYFYTGIGEYSFTSTEVLTMPSGYYPDFFSLWGERATCEEVVDYISSLGFEKDKRDLPGILQDTLNVIAESQASQEAAETTTNAETTTAAATDDSAADIAEINEYYSSMIEMCQESIADYESDPDYDPSLIGADAEYYEDMAAELSREQALLERSGDSAGAAALQDQIDDYYDTAQRIYITNQYYEEILALEEEIALLEMEWEIALSS